MKRFFYLQAIAFIAALTLASCSTSTEEEAPNATKQTRQVMFTCGGEFSLESVTQMTRAINTNVTDVWVFDYKDGKLVTEIHQTDSDLDFGKPTIDLDYGKHTLYFVISNGKSPSIDRSNYNIMWTKPGDTFFSAVDVNVSENSDRNIDVNMTRVAGMLTVKVEGGFPESAKTFTMTTPKWFYSINYTSGHAIHYKAFTYTEEILDVYKGTGRTAEFEYCTLMDFSSFYTGVYLNVYNGAEENIGTASLGTVEMMKGKKCVYTGRFNFDGTTPSPQDPEEQEPGTTPETSGHAATRFEFFTPAWTTGSTGTW